MKREIVDGAVGLEWTAELEEAVLSDLSRHEVIELIPENFFHNKRRDFLAALARAGTPVVIHGVDLSLGATDPFKERHFEEFRRVADQVNTIIVSEHLCMTEAGGVELGQLCPLPYTQEVCDIVSRKIERIQKAFSQPFMLENVANRFIVPGAEMSEPELINRILSRTGCHLLLDLQNVYVNSVNFGFDPNAWIAEVDAERALGIHLAGGFYDEDGFLQDGHSEPIMAPVWSLYRDFCARFAPAVTIIERTSNVPTLEALDTEVRAARRIRRTARASAVTRMAAACASPDCYEAVSL